MSRTSFAAALVLLAACSSSSNQNATGGGAQTGQVKASLTDAPSDLSNVKQVNVTIDSVRIHDEAATTTNITDGGTPGTGTDGGLGTADAGDQEDGGTAVADAGTATTGDEGASGPGWFELCSGTPETFDLLTLTNGKTAPLCGGNALTVPAGRISQARLGVVSAQLVFNDGSTQDLTVPSGSQSGLKVNVDEDVPAGGTLEIKFDFVASDSIVAKGNGEFSLKPVIRVVK